MKIEKLTTVTETAELDFDGITLLSLEEYKEFKDRIPIRGFWWWLRSAGGKDIKRADGVNQLGYSDSCIVKFPHGGVSPVLRIKNFESSVLKIGDRFKLKNHTWTVISNDYALCDDSIGDCPFRNKCFEPDANDYEKSDVKEFVERWWNDELDTDDGEGA